MPEGKGLPSEMGSYGLSVHTQGVGGGSLLGPSGLAASTPQTWQWLGLLCLALQAHFPSCLPFMGWPEDSLRGFQLLLTPTIMSVAAAPCHGPTKRDHLVSRPWLS